MLKEIVNGKLGNFLRVISIVGTLLVMTLAFGVSWGINKNEIQKLEEKVTKIENHREEQVEVRMNVKQNSKDIKEIKEDVKQIQRDTAKIIGLLEHNIRFNIEK